MKFTLKFIKFVTLITICCFCYNDSSYSRIVEINYSGIVDAIELDLILANDSEPNSFDGNSTNHATKYSNKSSAHNDNFTHSDKSLNIGSTDLQKSLQKPYYSNASTKLQNLRSNCINQIQSYLSFSTLFVVHKVLKQGKSLLRLVVNVHLDGENVVIFGRLESRTGRVFLNASLQGHHTKFRKVCAAFCDEVYKCVTGEKHGIFNTKFYFIANDRPVSDRPLNAAQNSGTNAHQNSSANSSANSGASGSSTTSVRDTIAAGNKLSLCKMHFSKTRFKALSSGYSFCPSSANGKVSYIILNRKLGKYYLVVRKNGHKKNFNYVMKDSVVSPVLFKNDSQKNDSQKDLVVMNMFDTKGSNPYIRILNLQTGEKRDFKSRFDDLSPHPDSKGEYLYFSSNRNSRKHRIYKMKISTGEVSSVINSPQKDVSYQLPIPSPKGNLLACVKYISGVSSLISVVSLKSGQEEEIWNSGGRYRFIQSLSWSPNGEIFIAFTAEDFRGRSRLCIVNLLTKKVVEFDLSFDVVHACWGRTKIKQGEVSE